MKGLIFLCTLILTGVTLWGLKDVSSDDFGSTEIAGAAQMTIEKPKPTTAASVTAAPKRTEDACMIWGGFPVGDLVRVRLHLKRQHLEDKVLIQDRFGPERFIAYLGRMTTRRPRERSSNSFGSRDTAPCGPFFPESFPTGWRLLPSEPVKRLKRF